MKKIFGMIWRHKIRSLIILAILAGGGYFAWTKFAPQSTTVRYVTGTVEKGVLSSTISGTGQVEASKEVTVTAKVSGDVSKVYVKEGDTVKSGQMLVALDATDAIKAVKDAQTALETAQLEYEDLVAPADKLTLLQAENSLAAAKETLESAKENKTSSEEDLITAYEDGFNAVSSVFLNMPEIMSGLDTLFYGNDYENNQSNLNWYANHGNTTADQAKAEQYMEAVETAYKAARASYNDAFDQYKSTTRSSSTSSIEALILQTYEMCDDVSDTVKDAKNLLDFVKDIIETSPNNLKVPSTLTSHQSTLENYTSTVNSDLSSLLSVKSSITNNKNSIVSAGRSIASAERSIAEKEASMADLKAGADELEIRAKKITVAEKQTALADTRSDLADYYIKASFDGVLASLSVEKGDTVSNGGTVGTLITKNQIATISLNEVDIAKVSVGQKATMTFDAVEGLTITGEVADVDTIGTTSSGVVSYNVTVAFDVQDSRVKPGMTATVNIILSSKSDVLLVKTSAIKTATDGSKYVMVMASGTPQNITVTTGDSNDTQTEITSGLNEGDTVVTQTITSSGSSSTGGSSSSGSSSKSSSNNGPSGGMMMGL